MIERSCIDAIAIEYMMTFKDAFAFTDDGQCLPCYRTCAVFQIITYISANKCQVNNLSDDKPNFNSFLAP